ncbi:bifunctional ADP-dependent NAD(P)H-hydrate dehydratase/NAD(P)H-hydrate epimerase [Haloarcula sp. CBA1127]|uniref:bifunctional ADP-dependent NAD(P)H-hydrate dehydratase/NAD(P)H-hydrate epimerase n=1 Tax=Haloarcula sp. CBA1127 TaxID=1765055 RepID=UPI00073EEB3B|nr:bifunctional ADP-dependent NAD(P)H-hydrate dehydratase/NAD(P)H-hydrate epimerase [Haloarcula sp. CBA1127]
MLTGSEIGVVDENAAALGVPRKQLMESSGHAVAQAVRTIADPGDQVTIVAGRGNNGGDALVAARFLDDYDLRVLLLGRPGAISTTIARENWDALQHAEYPAETVTDSAALDLGTPDIVVDAMLGTGIDGDLREPAATAAQAMNESGATVLSVDVPSGLDAETGRLAENAVDADHVVTFHDTKPGLPDLDVPVTVADIGIPDAAELFIERGDLTRLERDPASHKGDNGEVLVVGGGPYTGAPALSAQAALRGGADLVRVACPAVVAREIQSYSENLILRPFDGDHLAPPHVDRLAELAADHDTLIVGPGLGDADATLEAVGDLLSGFEGTAVVDADALSVVPDIETDAELVCTPHQGELLGMGGETAEDWRERADLVESFASEVGQTLLVKGPYDIVSDGEQTRVGRTGNPGMTVGGTGDVLAGVTGALASVQDPLDAAAIAAYTVGSVGDRVVDDRGYGLVATDLLDEIPSVLWQREAEP